MKAQLVQFSAVVAGNVHNPSILSPDFLRSRDIVSDAWAWEVAENLTTPAFALVRYTNGVQVTVEPNKLQILDAGVGEDPIASKATAIAFAYVATLPHVPYSAVGMNYQSVIEHTTPGTYLKDRFLNSGAWDNTASPLQAVGLRFVYDLRDGGLVTLSLDAGEVERANKEEKQRAVIARANFHRDCTRHADEKEIREHFDRIGDDWLMYLELLTKTVGCE